MEIRHLKLVKTVADTGTLTKASRKLYLSQSALSHQLKELEAELGGKIFLRVNKKMILSQVGEQLYSTASSVLDQLHESETRIRNSIGGIDATIRLSAQCYTFYNWLSGVLSAYRDLYPGVDIKIMPEATFSASEWLAKAKLDIAIFNYKPEVKDFSFFKLFDDELVLITNPTHPLQSKKFVKPSDLSNVHFITYLLSKGCISRAYKEVFIDNEVEPAKLTEVQLTEVILEMVRSGLGVSIMARWAVENYLEKGYITAIPIGRAGMHRSWYAATLKNKLPPEYLLTFIQCLQKANFKQKLSNG